MTWLALRTILAVIVVTAFFTWTMVWYVRSSMSHSPRVRRRLQIADAAVSIAVAGFYAVRAASGKESKLALIVCGLVIGLWLLRGARFLLRRAKA